MTRNTFANLMVQIDVPQEANTVSEKDFFGGTHFTGYSASSSSFP
ncbi:11454_t:CDS:2 [Rhizophagus irregularis]|nr:11454_t:CDS:2 [Rhizophagus irregularis]